MITAEEFLNKGNFNNTADMLIEFAKLHVEEALNNIKKETQLWDDCAIIPYEKIIYPLENIK